MELNYKQKLDENWTANIGWTLQNPKACSKGVWSQDTAKNILNLGADFNKGKFVWNTRLFTYLDREVAYYNAAHSSSKIKDHHLKNSVDLSMTLSYMPTSKDTLRLSAANLLDRDDALNNSHTLNSFEKGGAEKNLFCFFHMPNCYNLPVPESADRAIIAIPRKTQRMKKIC